MSDGTIPLDLYRAALAERDEWKARYDDLLTKYHALRLEGQQLPLPRAQKAEADPVALAILQKAGGSRALRKHFADYVTMQRNAGVDEADIALAIQRGESDADDEISNIPDETWPVPSKPVPDAIGSVPVG